MNIIYVCMIAIFAADGCEEVVLLIPDRVESSYNSNPTHLPNLYNRNQYSSWQGSNSEYIYYYYTSNVFMKEAFVQRYYNRAARVQIYDSARSSDVYFETGSNEYYSSATIPINVRTNMIRFRVYYNSAATSYVEMSRLEAYGCYNTSSPTIVPTSGPTEFPTVFPTISPTPPPITTYPTETPSIIPTTIPTGLPSTTIPTGIPSISPTTAPTQSPSAEHPSTYPSTAPTWSPTVSPSHTDPPSPIPSFSPSTSPTVVYVDRGFQITVGQIEFFIIVVVLLCGVIFFGYRRHKKVLKAINHPQKLHAREMQIVHSRDIEEANTGIVTTKEFNRKGDMEKTIYNEGESSNAGTGKTSNHRVGEEIKERVQSHMLSDQTGEFRFGLDKVNSEL